MKIELNVLPIGAETIVCKVCQQEKTLEEMSAEKRNKNGRSGQCKPCRSKSRYENGSYFLERLRKHAIRTGRPTMYTEKVVEMMKAATNCCYCDVKLTHISGAASQATFDHVYLNKNIDDNLVVCCRGCNASKFQDHVYKFYQRSESFTDELFYAFAMELAKRFISDEPTPAEVESVKFGLKLEAEEMKASEAVGQ